MNPRRLALGYGLFFVSNVAAAQQPELRVDALGPEPYSVQPGVGLITPLGAYARLGASVGYALAPNVSLIADRWRADLIARLTLDPYRQQRWALSVGGGLSFRRRVYLAAIVDLEGPEIHGVLPALQLGASGGVRAGFILRRAVERRR